MGQGPGLSQNYQIGESAGVESVTLTAQQTPTHNHSLTASTDFGQNPQPQDAMFAQPTTGKMYTGSGQSPLVSLANTMLSPTGGSQPHENMQPYLCINFIISLFGVYPTPT